MTSYEFRFNTMEKFSQSDGDIKIIPEIILRNTLIYVQKQTGLLHNHQQRELKYLSFWSLETGEKGRTNRSSPRVSKSNSNKK